jgi:hypothetical protein
MSCCSSWQLRLSLQSRYKSAAGVYHATSLTASPVQTPLWTRWTSGWSPTGCSAMKTLIRPDFESC